MATAYYSTQATIEARISSLRLKRYIDFDGDDTPDTESLTSAFSYARAIIDGKLASRYGSDIIDTWDSDTAPDLVKATSDDLCIYQLFISNPRFAETGIGQTIRQNALDLLDSVVNFEMSLYGTTTPNNTPTEFCRIKSDFDPERDHDKQSVRTTWILPDTRQLPGYPE